MLHKPHLKHHENRWSKFPNRCILMQSLTCNRFTSLYLFLFMKSQDLRTNSNVFLGNYGWNRMWTICLCEIANVVPKFSKSTNYVSHDSCCTWLTPYYKHKIPKSMSLTQTPDELLPRPKGRQNELRRPLEKEQKQTKPFHSSHCSISSLAGKSIDIFTNSSNVKSSRPSSLVLPPCPISGIVEVLTTWLSKLKQGRVGGHLITRSTIKRFWLRWLISPTCSISGILDILTAWPTLKLCKPSETNLQTWWRSITRTRREEKERKAVGRTRKHGEH